MNENHNFEDSVNTPLQLGWKDLLAPEKEKPYFQELLRFIEAERQSGKKVYPKNSEIFNSLQLTPLDQVKVVILGQDPYHGPNQAHGLCFSVNIGIPLPPSLLNIFKELKADLGVDLPTHGNLESWAKQGVLLLNASLTVRDGEPQSHANKGWEIFTDKIVAELNQRLNGIVFILWGASAQKKGAIIDRTRHFVLEAPHPSPLSASRGFFGCRHFSKTNELLVKLGQEPINWKI